MMLQRNGKREFGRYGGPLVRARRGARWLDENFPGWEERIDPKTLDLESGYFCICGQVFKDKAEQSEDATWRRAGVNGYTYACNNLFADANSWISLIVPMRGPFQNQRRYKVGTALGFIEDNYVIYADLQTAWRRILKERGKGFVNA